ncbi:USP6 N-terminal-like protein [Clonorchis sinensis]|uniref:USP6 N-terminal-like protein n=2 Tax=Opisthorchiidae TaxID=6196 RepID=G7Y9C8_CLOSI|nr:USP6 N-terminal-like protein [Clonorchis sinensis]
MASGNIHPEFAAIVEKYTNGCDVNAPENPLDDPDVQDAATVDRFGFYHPDGVPEKGLTEEEKLKQARRLEKWREMTYLWDGIDSTWRRLYRPGRASEKLTRRIYKGIPQQFRMIVWPLLLCVPEMKNLHKNLYPKMLQRALATSIHLDQIDKDINRTFRNTTYFRARYGSRQQSLFHILAAYSVYNTEVGYCQGMSELVGLFLTYIIEEEDAFWALSQLMGGNRYKMHGVYVHNFPGLYRLFEHHERVVKRLLPSISKHFAEQDLSTSTYALKWFMQCFLDRLPVSLVLRLWDIFLLEGEKILIAMAYNILKMHKKRLLRMDQAQLTCFFQDELVKDFQFDDDTVIESLKDCLEQLRRSKLDQPPPPTMDMLPRRPVGSPGAELVWQSQPLFSPRDLNTTPALEANKFASDSGSLKSVPRRSGPSRSVITSQIQRSKQSPSLTSSPGMATSASILTMKAMSNRSRGTQISVTQKTVEDTPSSPASSTSRTSRGAGRSESQPSSRGTSSPRSSRLSVSSQQSRHSPVTYGLAGLDYGFATTDSKRHQAAKASYMSPVADRIRNLRSGDSKTSSQTNNVVLISVRPRKLDTNHEQVVDKLANMMVERAHMKSSNMEKLDSDRLGRWSSERVVFIGSRDVPVSSISSTSGLEDNDQPWQLRCEDLRKRDGHRKRHGDTSSLWSSGSSYGRNELARVAGSAEASTLSTKQKDGTLVAPDTPHVDVVRTGPSDRNNDTRLASSVNPNEERVRTGDSLRPASVIKAISGRHLAPTSSGISKSLFKPRCPIYLATFNVRTLKQVGQRADIALTVD